jgi:hypothetical protein
VRHGADMPDVAENLARVGNQERGEFAVMLPAASDGLLVDRAAGGVEEKRLRRNIGLRAIEADVALALLLGIVKRMRVQERPDELAGDIFQAELEMGVLVNGVMAAVKSGGADVEALLVGDFFGRDQVTRVAGARGGDGGVEGMGPGVPEGYAGRGGFDEFARERIFEHAGLRGHYAKEFNTEHAEDTEKRGEERRREKKSNRGIGEFCSRVREKENAPFEAQRKETQRALRSAEEKRTGRKACPTELLFRGGGFCGGVGVFLLETLDSAGSVHQFLLAGEEGVAARADFDAQHLALHGRARLEGVAAGAMYRDRVIIGMNTGFHEAPFCRVRSARLT